MCETSKKYVKPRRLPKKEVERLVAEYKELQANGLKPKNLPRCRLRACSCRIKLEKLVQGFIFCSDECITIFNKKLTFRETRKMIKEKPEERKRCVHCNKYLKAHRYSSGYCTDQCHFTSSKKKNVDAFIAMLKQRDIKHERCIVCNKYIPYDVYRKSLRTDANKCSVACKKQFKKNWNNRNNERSYYKHCLTCGIDIVTNDKDFNFCIPCNNFRIVQKPGVYQFDFGFMDQGSAYMLGIFYNVADMNKDEIIITSNREVCEFVKTVINPPTEIYLDSTDERTYILRVPNIPMSKILYNIGLEHEYLERDLPMIEEYLLPLFYDGLMYSSGVFYDLGKKYYPMVSDRICSAISAYKGMPMDYVRGMWCLYEEIDNRDNTDYGKLYDDMVIGE